MSNATNSVLHDNLRSQPGFDSRANTQGLRHNSAENAPGFAQVLQAFDSQRESKPELVESRSQVHKSETQDRESEQSAQTNADASDQNSITESTSDRDQATDQVIDQQADQTDEDLLGVDVPLDDQSAGNIANSDLPNEDASPVNATHADGQVQSAEVQGETPPPASQVESETKPQHGTTTPVSTEQSTGTNTTQSAHRGSVDSKPTETALPQTYTLPSPAQSNPEQAPSNQGTQIQDASRLDLLVNQGDMAKLSIRGLMRSLREQSNPDLTTLAIQTQIGETEQSTATTQRQILSAPKPDVAPSTSSRAGPFVNDSSGALSEGVPQSPRTGNTHIDASGLKSINQAAADTSARNDQSRVDVQQTRSTRIEASNTGQSNQKIDLSRISSLQNATMGSQANRVEGALTSRAVSGIAAGSDAASLSGTRSQAQRLNATSDPSAERASMLAQVQRGLAKMLRSGTSDITLKLTPGHLGEVRIQIKRDGDRVSLRFTASSEGAREMLSSGSKELVQTLTGKGITVERVQVELQTPPDDQTRGDASDSNSQHSGSNGQGNTPGRRDHHKEQDEVIPLEFQPINPDQADPDSVWSEFGLDAIA